MITEETLKYLTSQLSTPFLGALSGIPVSGTHPGQEISFHEHLLPAPSRIKQHRRFGTAESFASYVERFATENTSIYANLETRTFVAILDHSAPEQPSWEEHTAKFQCCLGTDLKMWRDKSGAWQNQEDFSLCLERRASSIVEPSAAQMLEIAQTLDACKNVKFRSGIRLDNGQVQITYQEELNGSAGSKGDLRIPQEFTLALSVYQGEAPYSVTAKFRYRIKDATLLLAYELMDLDRILEHQFEEIVESIKTRLDGKAHFYHSA